MSEIARIISEHTGYKITKCAVIGQVHRRFRSFIHRKPKPHRKLAALPGPSQCAYPLGDPRDPGFAYCLDPIQTDGRPYCDRHHDLTHIKEPPREVRIAA
jgi:hypothetical protein